MPGSTANNTPPLPLSATQPDQTSTAVRPRDVIVLIGWLLLCAGLVFWRTFHVAYGFDDIAHLHALACLRTGEITFTTWLFHQHNEHIVPMMRLYFMAATRISGLSSWALHVMIFLTYVTGAVACAWIFFSITRSRLGAFLAGTIYAGAGGFCGGVVWQPTVGQFSVAGTPLILAMAILVSPYSRKRWTDAAVLLLIVVASMGMGGAAIAGLAIPLYLALGKPELISAGRRRLMIALTVLLVAAVLLWTRWLMGVHGVHGPTLEFQGIYNGLFLVLSAPGRFLLAWTPFGEIGLRWDVAASVVGLILFAASWRLVPKTLRTLLLALWTADGLLVFLIGTGRINFTYADLFSTERYYFFFLLPLALHAAAALEYITRRLLQGASPTRRTAIASALGCLMLAALVMSHVRSQKQMIWWLIDEHQLDFREAKVLAKVVKAKAAEQHLHLADGPIRFPGSRNEHLGFSAIILTQFPKGLPGVVWSLSSTPTASVGWPWNVPPISDADAAVQNQIFDEWSKKIARPPYSCVIGGEVRDVLPVKSCEEAAAMPNPPLAPARPFN